MHLFAALSGLDIMGSNKDLIHLFITGGKTDLVPLHWGLRGMYLVKKKIWAKYISTSVLISAVI